MDYPNLLYLKCILHYDPETGIFTWLKKRSSYAGKVKEGAIAGSLKTGIGGGYIKITVDRIQYRAHCLAWYYMTGSPVPKGLEIDHIDRNRKNNAWKNLRAVSRSQNCMNHGLRSNNISGVRGVSWHAQCKKWMARITVEGNIIHLGLFPTVEDAASARKEAEKKYYSAAGML